MASFTLDELRAVVEEKYAPLDIPMGEAGTVRLIQALRLSEDKLTELTEVQREFNAIQKTAEAEDGDEEPEDQLKLRPVMIEKLQRMIRIAAETEKQAELLITAVGDDMPLLMEIISRYGQSTQLGEASASPSS